MIRVGVLPDFGDHTKALGADEAVALALVELDNLVDLEIFSIALIVGAADGYTGFASYELPDLGTAEVILPGEAFTALHHEYLGAELAGHLRESYLQGGEELVAELAGLPFVDHEEATPGALEIARRDGKAEAIEVLLYTRENFFLALTFAGKVKPQFFQCLAHDSGTYFLMLAFYEARQIKAERAIKTNFISTLLISFWRPQAVV
jgi:hypothetical protein